MSTENYYDDIINTTFTSLPEENNDYILFVNKWLLIILYPIITILGIIGNMLVILTMRRKGAKTTSVSVFMCALAIADSTVLILDFLNNWFEEALYIDVMKNNGFCIFHRYFFNVAYTYASWLVAAISVERFIVVWLPLKAKSICTVRGSLVTVGVLFLILIIFYINNLWGWSVKDEKCDVKQSMAKYLNEVSPWLSSVLYSYGPLLVIFFTSSAIIYRLAQASSRRMEMSGPGNKSDGTRKTTLMMLSICVSFFILTLPVSIWYIIIFDQGLFIDTPARLRLGETLVIFFALLNHAINFILYGLTSAKFRNDVKALLYCHGNSESTFMSSTTHQTYASEMSTVTKSTK